MEINICTTSDDNYSEHMYITLFSALYNLKKGNTCDIFILDSGLNNKSKDLLKSLEEKFLNCSVKFIPINNDNYKNYPSFGGTRQTYYRLDIPNILSELDKVLYLDPDIVVNGDISELYKIDISDYSIAAPTEEKHHLIYDHVLKFKKKDGYINGGVLLMNLKYFRENKLSEKLINYLSTAEKIYFYDQDALNKILWDSRKPVEWKYNVTEIVAYKHIFSYGKAVIIHFCGGGNFMGGGKPRLNYCTHPYKSLYVKYRKLSGLNKILLPKTNYLLFIKSKRKQLYLFCCAFIPRIIFYLGLLRLKIQK